MWNVVLLGLTALAGLISFVPIFRALRSLFNTPSSGNSRSPLTNVDEAVTTDVFIEHTHHDIDGIRTRVTRTSKKSQSEKSNTLVIIIPGNPGLSDFYTLFAQHLLVESGGAIEKVDIVSHAGHSPCLKGRKYNLDDQIKHKISYVKLKLKENPHLRIILAGHSIGAYICLKVLESEAIPDENFLHGFMLFPTVMDIAKSPNGVRLSPMLKYGGLLAAVGAGLMSIAPDMIQNHFVRRVSEDYTLRDPIKRLMHYNVARNCFWMAHDEMIKVTSLPYSVVDKHISRLTWYFTPSDEWAPPHHFYALQKMFPHGRLYMHGEQNHSVSQQSVPRSKNKNKSQKNTLQNKKTHLEVPHVFVMGASDIVAKKVWEWLHPELQKLS